MNGIGVSNLQPIKVCQTGFEVYRALALVVTLPSPFPVSLSKIIFHDL